MNFKEENIIFFDGECNLCDKFIQYVLKRDGEKIFTYATLQGKIAHSLLNKKDIKDLRYILFLKKGKLFKASYALFEVMKLLYPRGALVFKILPMSFYSFFYYIIAKNRYKFFGRKK